MTVVQVELVGKNGRYAFNPKDSLSANGRFGSVFKGTSIDSGKPVVVKYFNPVRGNAVAAFRFKAEALYAFQRPDIQDSIDYIINERGTFLIKEFIPGKTLKSVAYPKITLAELKDSLVSLCDTLLFLHEKGIVHADIKPANIIWPKTAEGLPEKPVLIDFGLARWDKLSYTDSMFSFIYSAPEQVLGLPHLIGPHSDLFSLGVCVYEILTGQPPYEFDSDDGHPALIEQAQITMPFPVDRFVPDDWYALISAVCKKPEFKKPPARYLAAEREQIVKDSIALRPASAKEFKEMVLALDTSKPRKKKWGFLGI